MRALPLCARWVRLMAHTDSALQNRLLGAMSQTDMDRFFSDLHPVPLTLFQDIYRIGAPLQHVYFVEQGVASILTQMTNGESIEAGMIGPEGMVGLPALFGNEMRCAWVPPNALRRSIKAPTFAKSYCVTPGRY
jgi:CRP-like cAMP-binding protein